MERFCITAAAVLCCSSLAVANHRRLSLDQKIRASDLVVVGTVLSVDAARSGMSSSDPAENVSRVATISIEQVLHGQAADTVKVGFRTTYRYENHAFVRAVAFSPDGKTLAMAGGGRLLKLWNVATGKQELTLFGHHGAVSSVGFSDDGTKLVSAAGQLVFSGEVKTWELPAGVETASMTTERGIQDANFTPGVEAIVLSIQGKLMKWNLSADTVQTLFEGYGPSVRCSTISKDGKLTANGGSRQIIIRDSDSGQELFSLDGFEDYVSSVSFAPDGSRLAASGGAYLDKGLVKVWSTEDGQLDLSFFIQGECSTTTNCNVSAVAFSPDGKYLATSGGSDFVVRVWEATFGNEHKALRGHKDSVSSVAWSPDGKLLASGSRDRTAKIWNVEDGKLLQTLSADETFIPGERYVLFLRKLARPYMAVVNWQYGVSHVADGALDDPRWPSDDASWTNWFNKRHGVSEPDSAPKFNGRIRLDEAVRVIQSAVAITEAQVQLGRIDIDGDLAYVFYERGGDEQRVYVRFPRHAACPDFDVQRLGCTLKTQDQIQQPRGRPKIDTAPVSVGSLKDTTQVVYVFPSALPRMPTRSVLLKVDHYKKAFCVQRGNRENCRIDYVFRACRACGSFETVPNLGGCIRGNKETHCDACGFEW